MRKLTGLFVLCFLLSANALQAAEPEKVTSAAESTEISTDKEKKEKVANDGDNYKKFRFGGYGEMVASFKDYGINRFYGAPEGNPDKHRNTISIPRFVLALDYKFNSKWILGAEIEFESGGTGTAYELENTETVSMKRRWKGWRSGYRAIPHYPFNCSTIQHTCRSRHCPGRIDQRPS